MIALYALDREASYGGTTYSPPKRFVTEAEYWEKYYDDSDTIYEWNDGKLEEKPVADPLDYLVYKWYLKRLDDYLEVYPIAQTTGLEIGFRLALPHKTVIRRPDLGVVLNNNPVPLQMNKETYNGTFDLCVESVSDLTKTGRERDTVDKKWESAKGGVKEYHILDAETEHTAFYHLNAQGVSVPIKPVNGVIKSLVLPGFQFRIDDLYSQPTAKELSDDPVYQGFVFLDYQEEKRARQEAEAQAHDEKRARQEAEQRANAEAQRADAAEAELVRLRALLVTKDN